MEDPNEPFFLNAIRLSALCAAIAIPADADAAPMCDSRDVVLDILGKQFAEMPVGIGLVSNGALVEVLATGDGETWTIIMTLTNGKSCILMDGENWRSIKPLDGPDA